MAKLPSSFKRKDHGSMRDFRAIPIGDYKAKIIDSEYKANSKETGHFLSLIVEVQDKEVKGFRIWAILNLDNENETTVQIANDEFATILDACGKKAVKDSKELHGILMNITVGIKDDKNVIKMYDMVNDGSEINEDLEEEEKEKEDEKEEDEKEEKTSSDSKAVEKLAKKFKKLTDSKALKKILSDYDIAKVSEIADLDEDDLESLEEDLIDEIEDAED